MTDRSSRRAGCIVSLLLFVVAGLPLWALLLLGERPCDTHAAPPCAITWGWVKLMTGGIIVAVCLTLGWLVSVMIRLARKNNPSDDVR